MREISLRTVVEEEGLRGSVSILDSLVGIQFRQAGEELSLREYLEQSTASAAGGDRPNRIKTNVGGLEVIVKSQKINLLAYKEVSGKVIVRASKQERQEKSVDVVLKNVWFFQEPAPDPTHAAPLSIESFPVVTRNRRKTVLRHFAVGFGVKLNIDKLLLDHGLHLSPSLGPVPQMLVTGVVTMATVTIGGETEEFVTQKGTVG
jgi:hypothetical protein